MALKILNNQNSGLWSDIASCGSRVGAGVIQWVQQRTILIWDPAEGWISVLTHKFESVMNEQNSANS